MASYRLEAFERIDDIAVFSAVEVLDATQMQVAFWLTDPTQQVLYPPALEQVERQDFLWEHTCFELFLGIKQQDAYREIHLVPSGAWQAYAFEEYRYPEQIPPVQADDIQLVRLQRTKYGVNAVLDLKQWFKQQQIGFAQVFMGMTAVLETRLKQHYFALQHSRVHADFHNKRDWLHEF